MQNTSQPNKLIDNTSDSNSATNPKTEIAYRINLSIAQISKKNTDSKKSGNISDWQLAAAVNSSQDRKKKRSQLAKFSTLNSQLANKQQNPRLSNRC